MTVWYLEAPIVIPHGPARDSPAPTAFTMESRYSACHTRSSTCPSGLCLQRSPHPFYLRGLWQATPVPCSLPPQEPSTGRALTPSYPYPANFCPFSPLDEASPKHHQERLFRATVRLRRPSPEPSQMHLSQFWPHR